jgi:hypothetical protein
MLDIAVHKQLLPFHQRACVRSQRRTVIAESSFPFT